MKSTFDTTEVWENQLVSMSLKAEALALIEFLKSEDACQSIRDEWTEDLAAIKRVYHYYSGKQIK